MIAALPDGYKCAFIDAEYTGEHARTTLVSLAVVGENGESLHLAFDDFARDQVTPWLETNVLAYIPPATMVSRASGWRKLVEFFDGYRNGANVSLVSFGKMQDIVLLFELWHGACPERKYFHSLHCLPPWLNHSAHYDMPTIFMMCGVDPNSTREAFLGNDVPPGRRHDALYDALATRACFYKCLAMPDGR